MKFARTLATLGFCAVLVPAAAGHAQSVEELPEADAQQLSAENGESESAGIDLEAARRSIIKQTNAFREQQGLDPVESNPALQEAAVKFAEFMAESRKYGHHADGRSPSERAVAAGYKYCIVLENIAYRQQTRGLASADLGTHFFEGWKESPEHRENMLDAAVTQTGVGLAVDERGTSVFAVQMFGRPESKQLRIEVTNEASEAVQLTVDSGPKSRQFQLPPRSSLTLQRCRPTQLSVGDGQSTKQAEESSQWVIQPGDEQPVLRRADSDPQPPAAE